MMSISPEAAQPPYVSVSGSIQKAGQKPRPMGSEARISKRPPIWLNSPSVFRRAEVYAMPPYDSARALIVSRPLPTEAFCGRSV